MSIHGGIDQYDRDSTMDDFKAGNIKLLVSGFILFIIKIVHRVQHKKREKITYTKERQTEKVRHYHSVHYTL